MTTEADILATFTPEDRALAEQMNDRLGKLNAPRTRLRHYVLTADRVAVLVTFGTWAVWYERAHTTGARIVQQDRIGEYFVSTVFLALDQSFGLGECRQLFETMVFPHERHSDLFCERYATWDQAVAGHADVVSRLRAGILFAS